MSVAIGVSDAMSESMGLVAFGSISCTSHFTKVWEGEWSDWRTHWSGNANVFSGSFIAFFFQELATALILRGESCLDHHRSFQVAP